MKQIDVLIIDDEKKFADMLSKRLALRNVRCSACFDGTSGISWLQDHQKKVSLILLDLNLPDIYGIQVMAEIKKFAPDLPIVIVTGHGSGEDKNKCLAMGAHSFINKPIRIETIVQLLEKIKGAKC
jgi:DNA-binding NtrC family response regulator